MEQLPMNTLLQRTEEADAIRTILHEFELNKHNVLFKKGIYVYGDPGTGKTTFVTNILKELDYDVVKYDAGDIRNTAVIEDITNHKMADRNIMSLFHKKARKIAIVMDEIDGMNSGDKGGINTLIKLIRPKKTKKQKLEDVTMNPIICIGNYKVDKKIKELMKVCNTVELPTPSSTQMSLLVDELMATDVPEELKRKVVTYVQGDLRKLNCILRLYKNRSDIFASTEGGGMIESILQLKSYSDDTKKITHKLLSHYYTLKDHTRVMNETDRTSVGLLWHENIIDLLGAPMDKSVSIPFYVAQLDNICFADYIDRITFQKQIWQFNEMSSLIKTFKNNRAYHMQTDFPIVAPSPPSDIRFTKVLTKYSTEYNNSLFIQKLCQKLAMDKKDLFGFFSELRDKYEDAEIVSLLENYEIGKLDVNRIYRYIEKYTKENATGTADKEVEEVEEDDDAVSVVADA